MNSSNSEAGEQYSITLYGCPSAFNDEWAKTIDSCIRERRFGRRDTVFRWICHFLPSDMSLALSAIDAFADHTTDDPIDDPIALTDCG